MGRQNTEKKEFQIGFRITRSQKEKIDAVIQRAQARDKRVESTEIYEELMSLRVPEFVTDSDRRELMGEAGIISSDVVSGEVVCCKAHIETHRKLSHILHDGSQRGEWITGNLVTFYERSLEAGPAPPERQEIPRPTGPIKRIPRKIG